MRCSAGLDLLHCGSQHSHLVSAHQLGQGMGDAVDALVIKDSHAWCPFHMHT
jgi:hypothetical protein